MADCYPDITTNFAEDLVTLLRTHHAILEPELREKVVGSLVLLRNKDLINSTTLFNTLFPLLITTGSKALRALLSQKILSDLRSSNAKTTNHKLNRSTQTALFNLVTSDRSSSKAIWAVKITRELWKRQIWTDAKAVEIMKEASLSENEKVIAGGVRFFLGGDKEREEAEDSSSDEEEGVDMNKPASIRRQKREVEISNEPPQPSSVRNAREMRPILSIFPHFTYSTIHKVSWNSSSQNTSNRPNPSSH